jgi:hypothetical protein
MSEAKPTLVYGNVEAPPLNSWLSNFPSGSWTDAESRGWSWVILGAVSVPNAYEYRIRFDNPTESFTLIFPYVVKTSDKGVKKVFIDGIEYKVRSEENYGNMFVVSGREFNFKCATKYKLGKRVIPILSLEYKQAVLKSVEFLIGNYIGLRNVSSKFKTTKATKVDYVVIRNSRALYITSNLATCDYITTRTISNTFNNINTIPEPVIANCRDTSWARFGGVWQSCETWIP